MVPGQVAGNVVPAHRLVDGAIDTGQRRDCLFRQTRGGKFGDLRFDRQAGKGDFVQKRLAQPGNRDAAVSMQLKRAFGGQAPQRPSEVMLGDLHIDLRARHVARGRDRLALTTREFALLEFLVLHEGEVVGRGEIAEHVWDTAFESMSNVIDVMIQRLRRKIDPPDGPSFIVTRRGEGYMLVRPEVGGGG